MEGIELAPQGTRTDNPAGDPLRQDRVSPGSDSSGADARLLTSCSDSSPDESDFFHLDYRILRDRVHEVFSVGYLTLMAIIQGAAFGILFLSLQQRLMHLAWSGQTILTIIQAIATGSAIVSVTQGYIELTIIVRWAPTIVDTVIPYFLGTGEIWMALAVGHGTSWWTALSVLWSVAVLAFLHTRIRISDAGIGTTEEAHHDHEIHVIIQLIISIVMLAPSVALAVLNSRRECPFPVNVVAACIVTCGAVLVVTLSASDQYSIYDDYGIPAWRPLRRTNRQPIHPA